MTKPRDPDALLAAYLADGMEVLPDRVVDAVLDEVRRTTQRAVFGPWRTRSMLKTALAAAAVFAVLVLGGSFFLFQRGQPALVGGPSQTPVIASPTASNSSTPSETPTVAEPTPGMFAYILPPGGQSRADQLWVANADGTGARRLAQDLDGRLGAPAWLPDGSRLVFSRDEIGGDGYPTQIFRLYLTDASGSEPQLVDTGCVAPCVGDSDAAFSSDGKRLVFVRTVTVPQRDAASVIATIDLATGQVTELASTTIVDCPMLPGQRQPDIPNCGGFADHSPRWSPDGTQIVFGQDVPSDINGPEINGEPGINYPFSSLFVVDADGGNLHRVSICCESADWSPDGTRIVFGLAPRPVPIISPVKGAGYNVDQNIDIYTVRPDGTDLRRLTSDKMSGLPSWTADGRIWFARDIAGLTPQLWIMDGDGSNATHVSVSPQLYPYNSQYGRPPKP